MSRFERRDESDSRISARAGSALATPPDDAPVLVEHVEELEEQVLLLVLDEDLVSGASAS